MTHCAARCGCKLCVVHMGCGEEVLPTPACVRGEGEGKGKGKEGSVCHCFSVLLPCPVCPWPAVFPSVNQPQTCPTKGWPTGGRLCLLVVLVCSACLSFFGLPPYQSFSTRWSKTFWLAPCAPMVILPTPCPRLRACLVCCAALRVLCCVVLCRVVLCCVVCFCVPPRLGPSPVAFTFFWEAPRVKRGQRDKGPSALSWASCRPSPCVVPSMQSSWHPFPAGHRAPLQRSPPTARRSLHLPPSVTLTIFFPKG